MDKCFYCHKEAETPFVVALGDQKGAASADGSETDDAEYAVCCSKSCAAKAKAFFRYAGRMLPFFWVGIVASMALVFAGVFVLSAGGRLTGGLLMGGGLGLLGVTSLVFPFGTPETFALLGVRKTLLTVRLLGAGMIVFGAVLPLLLR